MIAWASGLAFLGVAFVGGWSLRESNALALLCAVAAFGAAYLLARRSRRVLTTLEVSKFGIAEVSGQTRRVIPWNRGPLLRNRPLLRRFELSVAGTRQRILLDYSRLEFYRLLELVLELGGFLPADPDPHAVEPVESTGDTAERE